MSNTTTNPNPRRNEFATNHEHVAAVRAEMIRRNLETFNRNKRNK